MRSEKINQFKYKGISSADMGIIITQSPNIGSAERDEEYISLPGKRSLSIMKSSGNGSHLIISLISCSMMNVSISIGGLSSVLTR